MKDSVALSYESGSLTIKNVSSDEKHIKVVVRGLPSADRQKNRNDCWAGMAMCSNDKYKYEYVHIEESHELMPRESKSIDLEKLFGCSKSTGYNQGVWGNVKGGCCFEFELLHSYHHGDALYMEEWEKSMVEFYSPHIPLTPFTEEDDFSPLDMYALESIEVMFDIVPKILKVIEVGVKVAGVVAVQRAQ